MNTPNMIRALLMEPEEIAILIPTLNEELSISQVIKAGSLYSNNILILDGYSSDSTVEIAINEGAKIVFQEGNGKGNAIYDGLKQINGKIKVIVIVDGDSTYDISSIPDLIKPIINNSADLVVGNRIGGIIVPGAFTRVNWFGNKIISKIICLLYGLDNIDILSGFRAISVDLLPLYLSNMKYNGFETETEMIALTKKNGSRIESVPIKYSPRLQGSKSKLSPFKDGFRILKAAFLIKFQKLAGDQNHQ
ncbi:MAG: glycosyltransferase [Candidatus Heimdallarchaeota archaeon]|nr:glycosyltransferase [Candidatus Heimdallarchaeota archaeon]